MANHNEVTHTTIEDFRSKYGKQTYRKKPIAIEAYPVDHEFIVETMEGTMKGDAGDYVVVGVRNELYVVDQSVFHETYERTNKED